MVPWGDRRWKPLRYDTRCALRRRELDMALERFVTFCRTLPDVRAAYVLGSYATGNIGPTSDLDLLVVREKGGSAAERIDDFYRDARIGVAFDLIAVQPLEFAERLPYTSFGRTILSTARRIYAA